MGAATYRRRRDPVSRRAIAVNELAVVLLVAAGAYAVYHWGFGGGGSDHLSEIGGAQDLVRQKVGSGAHFEPVEETSVENLDGEKVRVSGTVDVVNPNGTGARYSYSVIMHRNPDGEWVGDDVSLIRSEEHTSELQSLRH